MKERKIELRFFIKKLEEKIQDLKTELFKLKMELKGLNKTSVRVKSLEALANYRASKVKKKKTV